MSTERKAGGRSDRPVGTGRLLRRFFDWSHPGLRKTGRWLLLGSLVGVVSGIGAIVFQQLFTLCSHLLIETLGGFRAPAAGDETGGAPFGPLAPWRLPLVAAVGGLLSGLLVYLLAPEAEGHGTDSVIRAFHVGLGKIRRRVPLVKMLATSITIGSGGSAGREGPIAQIGAGFGSFLGDALRLDNRQRRILMLAGVAGGIGSIFRAPLGAAFFAAEVLYREPEFEYEALMPGLLSAIVGYSIFASYAGWQPMFHTPDLQFRHPLELVAFALLGVVAAVVGTIYVRAFYGVRDAFHKLPVLPHFKPAIGAALVGVLGVFFAASLGMGYGYVQQAIDGKLVLGWMLVFVAAKVAATALTVGSGGSGGVFAPSLAIGGLLGGAFGTAVKLLAPGVFPQPAAFVMVGMGAFFAGAAKVPFASVVMVMEMTGSYGLLVPALQASAVAYLVSPMEVSLYENQVATRADSPAHLGSFAVDLLRHIRVGDALRPGADLPTLPEDLPAAGIIGSLPEPRRSAYAVVDGKGELVGLLTLDAVRRGLINDSLREMQLVDLACRDVVPVNPADDLRKVLSGFVTYETDLMPVVESPAGRRVIGMLSKGDVLRAYDLELRRRQGQDAS